jgi:hypothetical protein
MVRSRTIGDIHFIDHKITGKSNEDAGRRHGLTKRTAHSCSKPFNNIICCNPIVKGNINVVANVPVMITAVILIVSYCNNFLDHKRD